MASSLVIVYTSHKMTYNRYLGNKYDFSSIKKDVLSGQSKCNIIACPNRLFCSIILVTTYCHHSLMLPVQLCLARQRRKNKSKACKNKNYYGKKNVKSLNDDLLVSQGILSDLYTAGHICNIFYVYPLNFSMVNSKPQKKYHQSGFSNYYMYSPNFASHYQ